LWTLSKLEKKFGNAGFGGAGKIGVPGEKPLGVENRTNHKLNPQYDTGQESELGTHWWRRALSPLRHPCCPGESPQRLVKFHAKQ